MDTETQHLVSHRHTALPRLAPGHTEGDVNLPVNT